MKDNVQMRCNPFYSGSLRSLSFCILVALILAFLVAGCGKGDLSRDKAAGMIKEAYQNGTLVAGGSLGTLDFGLKDRGSQFFLISTISDYKESTKKWMRLKDQGMLEMTEVAKRPFYPNVPGSTLTSYKVEFTEKAKPFIVKVEEYDVGFGRKERKATVRLVTFDKVEVTGITKEGDTIAVVEYVATFKPTPFNDGPVLRDGAPPTTFKWRVPFRLFDDGWRIGKTNTF